jgi:hypothetical protein
MTWRALGAVYMTLALLGRDVRRDEFDVLK